MLKQRQQRHRGDRFFIDRERGEDRETQETDIQRHFYKKRKEGRDIRDLSAAFTALPGLLQLRV